MDRGSVVIGDGLTRRVWQLELTGADGGPVEIALTARGKLRDMIEAARRRMIGLGEGGGPDWTAQRSHRPVAAHRRRVPHPGQTRP